MIEDEIFEKIKGLNIIPTLTGKELNVYTEELRSAKHLLIGVTNGRFLAPNLPYWRGDVVVGVAILKTETNYRSTADGWIADIRASITGALQTLIGQTGTEIGRIDGIYATPDGADTAGDDESDRYFMHTIPITITLTRKTQN